MKRITILTIFAVAVGCFFYWDLGSQFTLANLKQQQADFAAQYRAAPFLVVGIFFLIYVLVTAASLPGALILTLAAGALFGVLVGTVVVSFASALGATIAFLSSRYIFRNAIKSRFGERLKAIDRGVEKDGPFYLLTLRLVPVFPFFLVNLLMGLTGMRARTFYLVSQAGMLLGTVIYVNAGTQLASVDELGDIGSPGLLLSFAALGLTPWIGKWILAWLKRRKVYSGFRRPKNYDRNLIVIGAGAAGLVSSYIAATVKAKVTLVEASKMGGDCLNYGCVPSKALIKSAKVAEQMRKADAYGLQRSEPQYSFRAVMQRIHGVIADIAPHDSVERYTELGVDVVKGYAKIVDPWTVEIKCNDGTTQKLTTRSIIVATGGAPFVPKLPGLEDVGYVTSDTLWEEFAELDEIPKRMIILGGGPIGCELSQAFARLGAEVTQIERGDRLLAREDEEVSVLAKTAQEGSGVHVRTGHEAVRCELIEGEKRLIVSVDGKESVIPFDALIIAVGRSARLEGFGLEELGIDTGKTVVVDDFLATSYPNIFAAGDVSGPYQFTHVAAHQAWYASVNSLLGHLYKFKADYRVIPWTTFIDPEIARVGLNEQEAKEKDIAYEVTIFQMDELDRAITEGATQGFVKVLTQPGKDKILGVTIVGDHAGELLAEYVLAMKYKLGLNKILNTIHTYPTMAEANKYAAGEWKRAHAPQAVLRLVERYHSWMRG